MSESALEFLVGPTGRTLGAAVWLPRPMERVFAFFGAAENLNLLTPEYLRFRILTPTPIEMQTGTMIEYRIRLHGFPMRWLTRIQAWEPPYRFVDEQIRGPYRRWVHEHRFEERDGGTLCTDRVEYAVPCDWFVHPLFVQRNLAGIFQYRARRLVELFGSRR